MRQDLFEAMFPSAYDADKKVSVAELLHSMLSYVTGTETAWQIGQRLGLDGEASRDLEQLFDRLDSKTDAGEKITDCLFLWSIAGSEERNTPRDRRRFRKRLGLPV